MKYMQIYSCATNDGPGFRVSLYVSGCRNHCIGCHNPESWDFTCGTDFTTTTISKILTMLDRDHISGLTIAGGEPFEEENQEILVDLVKAFDARFPDKDLWVYTGYEWADLVEISGKKHIDVTCEILDHVDVLVAGPFIQQLRDISTNNLWRGSTNQRCIDVKRSLEQNKIVYLTNIPNNK